MASMFDIVRGISQAVANRHDGAIDENGDPVVIGLRREEGVELQDKRVQDGFNVSFSGDKLCIHYHSEVMLKEVHGKNFSTDIESIIESIASFIKKEYRKVTSESLSLTKEGEPDIMVQSASRVRSWVTAKCYYKVGSYGDQADTVGEPEPHSLERNFKKFLEQGAEDAKKPRNVTVKGQ